jgi:hypothetical protein
VEVLHFGASVLGFQNDKLHTCFNNLTHENLDIVEIVYHLKALPCRSSAVHINC